MVTVTVYVPDTAFAGTVKLAVTCVGFTKTTLEIVIALGPLTSTFNRVNPGPPASAPGSKNSELLTDVPLIVIAVVLPQAGVADNTGVAGGGALNCAARTPHALVVGAYSENVHIVISSLGSTTVCV